MGTVVEIATITCSVLCFLYPHVQSFALWLASFFLKREKSLLKFIQCLNIPYLLIHMIVLLAYAIGEFSILSGWELVQTSAENGAKATGKLLIAALLAIVLPVMLFLMSIIYGRMSYQRILNPKDLLYDEEYGLKRFTTEKKEGAEAQAEIEIDQEPRIITRADWHEPAGHTNQRRRFMGLTKVMARMFAVGGTARYVAKGFFVALGHGILNMDNMETEEGLKEELHEFAQYILISRLNGPTAEFHKMLQLYEEYTGPGLTGLTIAILSVEAGFMENSEENQDTFREVIVEELVKKGIGERML